MRLPRFLAIGLTALMGVTGCAQYHQQPLAAGPRALTAPALAVLTHDAATIDRPYLKPVALRLDQPLDANAIAIIAVIANPDLKAQRARVGVTDAQAFAARLLPDPSATLGMDHILSGPDPFDQLIGQIGLDIAALRSRHVTAAREKAAAQQVHLDLAWAEWQTAGQARLQAARIMALQEAVALSQASAQSADSLFARTLRAAERGDLRAEDVEARRLAVLDASDKLRSTEQDLVSARFELSRILGFPPDTSPKLAVASPVMPPLDAAHLFIVAQAQRLDLKALEAGYASQEASVHKAVLDQFPTLTLNVTGTRDTGGNKMIGPAVSFTLPLWNRNRGSIALAEATRTALKAEYEARLFQTRADIAAAVGALKTAYRQRVGLLAQMAPLKQFVEASDRAMARGDLASATGEAARQSLRDKQIAFVQLDQSIAEQIIALELLTGVPMGDWTE